MKKNNLFLIITLCLGAVSFGQHPYTTSGIYETKLEYNKYRLPSITAGGGIMTFFGDIGTYDSKITHVGKFNRGLTFGIEQRLGAGFALSADGIMGSLSEIDNRPTRHLNFKSEINQGCLSLNYHFDNGYIINKTSRFSPFLSVGFGFISFLAKGDLRDKDDHKYYYWPDGTIRDQDFDWENPQLGKVLERDYTFETELDTLKLYTHNSLVIPVGCGLNFKFSDMFEANISTTYFFTKTDAIDNLSYQGTNNFNFFNKHNDSYIFTAVALQYNIGGKNLTKFDNRNYKGVRFGKLFRMDSDGDKVSDGKDMCADTPAGVKTDKYGCPIDTDKDGVPDYMDQEANTPLGMLTDENGVTITPQMFEEWYIRDSLAMLGALPQETAYTLTISNVEDSVIQQQIEDYYNSLTMYLSGNPDQTGNSNINSTPSVTIYRVQIGSVADPNASDYFKKRYKITEEIFVTPYKGTYKYSIGTFNTYTEARTYANQLNAKSKVNSFVISLKDGVRDSKINIIPQQTPPMNQTGTQALIKPKVQTQIQNQPQTPLIDTIITEEVTAPEVTTNKNITETTSYDVIIYRIQIGSVPDAESSPYFKKIYKLTDEIYVDQYKGTYKYSIGTFNTYAAAKAYLNKLKIKSGVIGFIIAFKDGNRIPVSEAKKIKGQ